MKKPNHENIARTSRAASMRSVSTRQPAFGKPSLLAANPRLAREWHPTKNGELRSGDVTPGSTRKVWWRCKKGHEWEASVANRNYGCGCPYCSGKRVTSESCLAAVHSRLASEWHPTHNGPLTPGDVLPNSNKKAWWKCAKGHEWEAVIFSRHRGNGCPYCAGKKADANHCLAAANPKLSKEWNTAKNGTLTPGDVTPRSGKKVWWKCRKGHEWRESVDNRNGHAKGCPYCSGQRACDDNCLATVNPKLAREWHPAKNGKFTPKDVTAGSGKRVWWRCGKGHEWTEIVSDRMNGNGCPYCSHHRVHADNCLATVNPKLARQWHPTKNGTLTPKDVMPGSGKKVWWKCGSGHEWPARLYSRNAGCGCPHCWKIRRRRIFIRHRAGLRIRMGKRRVTK